MGLCNRCRYGLVDIIDIGLFDLSFTGLFYRSLLQVSLIGLFHRSLQ